MNERIFELLGDLNGRPMRAYGASRRELYERFDRPALKPLPAVRFSYGEWKKARVDPLGNSRRGALRHSTLER